MLWNFGRQAYSRATNDGAVPLALLLMYLINAFEMGFPTTAMGSWLNNDLHMPPEVLSRFYATIFLPWSLKPLYVLFVERFPIYGECHRPYLIICSVGSSIMYLATAVAVDSLWSAFVIVSLRSMFNAIAEILLGMRLIALAQQDVSESASLQARATAARTIGSGLAFVLGVPMYCGDANLSLHNVEPRLVIGLTAIFPLLAAVCACFLSPHSHPRRPTQESIASSSSSSGERTITRTRAALPAWQRLHDFELLEDNGEQGDSSHSSTTPAAIPTTSDPCSVCQGSITAQRGTDSNTNSEFQPICTCGESNGNAATAPEITTKRKRSDRVSVVLGVAVVQWILIWISLASLVNLTVWWLVFLLTISVVVAGSMWLTSINGTPHQLPEGWMVSAMPLAFLFLYNAMPSAEIPWSSFNYYMFPNDMCIIQGMSMVSTVCNLVACWFYVQYMSSNKRRPEVIVAVCTVFSFASSLLRLPMASAWDSPPMNATYIGMSLPVYAILVGIAGAFIGKLGFLALQVFATQRCAAPERAEKKREDEEATTISGGLMYGIYLSFLNFGDSASGWLSAPLIAALGIQYGNVSRGIEASWTGLVPLILLATTLKIVVAFVFVPLLRWGGASSSGLANGEEEEDDNNWPNDGATSDAESPSSATSSESLASTPLPVRRQQDNGFLSTADSRLSISSDEGARLEKSTPLLAADHHQSS